MSKSILVPVVIMPRRVTIAVRHLLRLPPQRPYLIHVRKPR